MEQYFHGNSRERIIIERDERTTDSFGQERISWREFCNCAAWPIADNSGESFTAQAEHSFNIRRFNIRFVPGIQSTFRVKWRSGTYQIIGLTPILPNKGWQLTVELIR